MSDFTFSRNFFLDQNAVQEEGNNVQHATGIADSEIQTAKSIIGSVEGLAGSVPAGARCGALLSACAAAMASLAVADYLVYGGELKATLNELIDAALAADEETALEINKLIDAMNHAGLEANELTGLIRYRTTGGSYEEYLGHLREVWEKKYQPGKYEPEEERQRLLDRLTYYGYHVQTQVCSPDPVNLGNGNFLYDRVDLDIKGRTGIRLKRFYNAQKEAVGGFGKGWSHTYEEKIAERDGAPVYIQNDGGEEPFVKQGDGSWISVLTVGMTLWEEGEKRVLYMRNGDKLYFTKDGRITEKEAQDGNRISYTYDESVRLAKVSVSDGSCLQFTYGENGYIKEIADQTGRKISYLYDQKGKLCRAVMADGAEYSYVYDEKGYIVSVENPRKVKTVVNQYDESGRVVRQDFPDGGAMTYVYDDEHKETTLTERNGSKIVYKYDEYRRHIATTDEAGTVRYTYNKHNRKSSVTDRRGNTTKFVYDNKGNMTMIVNPQGGKVCFTYNEDARPSVVKGVLGGKSYYHYNENGGITEFKNPMGDVTRFSYDEKGQRDGVIFADGTTVKLGYDERGNVVCLTQADGSKWLYEYDALNRVTASVDGNGNRTTYQYDSRDRIEKVTDCKGNICQYVYNASGRVVRKTDFDGHSSFYEYNELNKPVVFKDKEQNETRYEYDLMWNLSRIVAPNGAVSQYCYDGLGHLKQVILPNGGKISYDYDADGNRTGITDPEGNHITYIYDSLNRMIKMTDADGGEHIYAYNKAGQLTMEQDSLGNRRGIWYDLLGRIIAETDFMGNRREYTYDSFSHVTEIRYPNGTKEQREYNKGGRLSKVILPSGLWESYEYDGNGNVIQRTDQSGNSYRYTYDYRNRITAVYKPDGAVRSWQYDMMGRVAAMTDENGNKTSYEYSPNGNLLSVTDALGNTTYYEYDAMGQLTVIQGKDDATGVEHKTTYLYDLMGLPKVMTDAHGNQESYQYDLNGRMIAKTDRDGYVTSYGYAPGGEINRIDYADGKTVCYEYDALRHLSRIRDWNGDISIENDALGRALRVTDSDGKEIAYTYGVMGERTGMTYPDGMKAVYEYDELTRLSALWQGEEPILYAYDRLGRLKNKKFPGGMETVYEYDAQNRISRLTHMDKEGILDSYSYGYDPVGNKTSINKMRRGLEEESGNYRYGYDGIGRLCTVTKDDSLQRIYEYDAFGNRIVRKGHNETTSYEYNELNQLILKTDAEGTSTYDYDKRGNLRAVMENGNVTHEYLYGAMNRLEWAVNGNGEVAAYEYNGLGFRIGKQEGQANPAKEVGSIDPQKHIHYIVDLTKEYHNLLQKEEDEQTQSFLWDGNVVSVLEENSREYYFQDELGSPIRLADVDGRLMETFGYDEFGQSLYGHEEVHDFGVVQPFGYTGYQHDRVSGTYFAQAREYLPEMGRFAGKDQNRYIRKDNAITWNQYIYCANNPYVYIDPMGKDLEEHYNPGSGINDPVKISINGNTVTIDVYVDITGDIYTNVEGSTAHNRTIEGIKRWEGDYENVFGHDVTVNVNVNEGHKPWYWWITGESGQNYIPINLKDGAGTANTSFFLSWSKRNPGGITMYTETAGGTLRSGEEYSYTIMHEMGHIWGIDDGYPDSNYKNDNTLRPLADMLEENDIMVSDEKRGAHASNIDVQMAILAASTGEWQYFMPYKNHIQSKGAENYEICNGH